MSEFQKYHYCSLCFTKCCTRLCNFYEVTKPDPHDVGFSFNNALLLENYSQAKNLFTEDREQSISEETLKKINEFMSESTSFQTYELLEFDNGEMVLINVVPDINYEIQDVIIVPDEYKEMFKQQRST